MNKKSKQFINGFTIIEISLFLGLSGLLAVGLMAGWSNSINRQRYNDTVSTFKSSIQQVFSDVENTQNSRTASYNCAASGGNVAVSANNAGAQRGQSNCVLLGKLISFGSAPASGTTLNTPVFFNNYSVRDVIGLDIDASKACGAAGNQPCTDDIEAFKATKFVVSEGTNGTNTRVSNTLEWGGVYKAITDNRSGKFSGDIVGSADTTITNTIYGVLILRSPIDGTVKAFGVPTYVHSPTINKIYNKDSERAFLRDTLTSEKTLITSKKKVDICIAPKAYGTNGLAEMSIFNRNKVVSIGNSSSSVEIAPMNGAGSITCDGQNEFNGVTRG